MAIVASNKKLLCNFVVETGRNERFEAQRKFETAKMDNLRPNEN